LTATPLPYHTPALLQQSIEALNIQPNGTYVDCTFGGGGHSRAILDALGPNGRLFAFDQDADAVENAFVDARFKLIPENFMHAGKWLRVYGGLPVNGLLADLGVSFHQFDAPERGFTFRQNAPLDMRMDVRNPKTAATLLNDADEAELAHIFRAFGDLPNGRQLARSIAVARADAPLTTTNSLVDAIEGQIRREHRKKYLAQVFQAIRIAVNDELAALETLLQNAPKMLAPAGRLVVLSYHSLEDRLVKNYLRAGNATGKPEVDFFGNIQAPFKPLTAKALAPTEEELLANPRARSAKMRVAERTNYSQPE